MTTGTNLISLGLFFKGSFNTSFQIWVQERWEEGALKGFWEFPGGKIEKGETPLEAVIREVNEEVGIDLQGYKQILAFKIYSHKYGERTLYFYTHLIQVGEHGWEGVLEEKGRWIDLTQVEDLNKIEAKIPPANYQMLEDLVRYIKEQVDKDGENAKVLWNS